MKKGLFTFVLFVLPVTCAGYETETHALMTDQSFVLSVLNGTGPSSTVHNLGLDRLDVAAPFNIYWGPPLFESTEEYWDNVANRRFTPDEFERCNMQEFLNSDPAHPAVPPQFTLLFASTVESPSTTPQLYPIQNWLVRGAIREDDLGSIATPLIYFGARCGILSIHVTTGDILRVVNHFYDPINNAGLGSCPSLFAPCQKSVDWGLGVVDSFPTPPRKMGTEVIKLR